MVKRKCAICGIDNSQVLFESNFRLSDINELIFSARRIPDKIHYRIVQCQKCGLVYSNPILDLSRIENLYKQSRYTYGEYEKDLISTYSRYLREVKQYLKGNKRLLEIGCGNGFFLLAAQKIGFKKVFGVEPGKETVAKANPEVKKHIINDFFKKGQFKKDYFDLICLFQVLDHIIYPNILLSECFKILKPGGGILCINHDVESWSVKLLREGSPVFDVEHTYLYSKKTLPLIFEKNNFKVVKIFGVANYYPFSYWLRMFPLPEKIKILIEKLSSLLGISEKRFWLKAGNIGIYAQKPG